MASSRVALYSKIISQGDTFEPTLGWLHGRPRGKARGFDGQDRKQGEFEIFHSAARKPFDLARPTITRRGRSLLRGSSLQNAY